MRLRRGVSTTPSKSGRRNVTLIADDSRLQDILEEWGENGWRVLEVERLEDTAGHPTHRIHVDVSAADELSAPLEDESVLR